MRPDSSQMRWTGVGRPRLWLVAARLAAAREKRAVVQRVSRLGAVVGWARELSTVEIARTLGGRDRVRADIGARPRLATSPKITPGSRSGWLGLLGGNERVELLHGTLQIRSAPGPGITRQSKTPGMARGPHARWVRRAVKAAAIGCQ